MLINFRCILYYFIFCISRDPNRPEDIQQYAGTVWPQFEMSSQKYIELTPNMTSPATKTYFANRAVQFWSKLIPELEKSAIAATKTSM